MSLYEQLKKLEQKLRSKGFVDVADRVQKLIDDTPVEIGVLEVSEED